MPDFQKILIENFMAVSYQLLRPQVKIIKTRLQITLHSKILFVKQN